VPPPRLELAVGEVVAGKYRLLQVLRRGGMGSVWVATHLGLDSPVAIKFMTTRSRSVLGAPPSPEELEEEAQMRTRFEREAKAAAQIRATNVVQILDYGIDRGVPYLVMELLQGEDLGARLARVKRLSFTDTATILAQVARALDRAHASGLVHRDLKPENVFLCTEGGEEVVKILDFGVAKAIHGDRQVGTPTLEGVVVGTPHYMSPEQAVGNAEIDHRSDLWSLGVIAFKAVTGRKPFEGELLLEMVVKICSSEPMKPSQVAPDLGPEVDRFFERALCRDPAGRFQSARELVTAFAELARGRGAPVPTLNLSGTYAGAAAPSIRPAPPSALPRVIAIGAAAAVGIGLGVAWWSFGGTGGATQSAVGQAPPPVASSAAVASPSPSDAAPTATASEAAPISSATASANASGTASASAGGAPRPQKKVVPPPAATATGNRDVGY
jgi:serine/threonine-protein kinase